MKVYSVKKELSGWCISFTHPDIFGFQNVTVCLQEGDLLFFDMYRISTLNYSPSGFLNKIICVNQDITFDKISVDDPTFTIHNSNTPSSMSIGFSSFNHDIYLDDI